MGKLLVLIGCEESQIVTLAFRALGHEAYSCDLKPCSGGHPEWHLQMDIFEAIKLKKWDFIGLHPVCKAMTLSGNKHYGIGKPKHVQRLDAVAWTINLFYTACKAAPKVYMENPMGAMNGNVNLPKPQVIQPYFFGDNARKTTCLWLHGLPFLKHSKNDTLFEPKTHVHEGDDYTFLTKKGKLKKQQSWYALAKGDRSESRSKTFPGIAKALAEQYSK